MVSFLVFMPDASIPSKQPASPRPGNAHTLCLPTQHCSLLPGKQEVCAQVS